MIETIVYPTLLLFTYDLQEGLGQSSNEVDENCKQFCRKFYGDLDSKTFEEEWKKIKSHSDELQEYPIELLETRYKQFNSPLDGFYYPLQIGDTYALQVGYSGKLNANGKYNDRPQNLKDEPFRKLKQDVIDLTFKQTGSIGQTWLLCGQYTEGKQSNEIEEIAKNCYTQAVSNYNWERDYIGRGQWLEGELFELWYLPQNIESSEQKKFLNQFRENSVHLLIWLFPDRLSPDEMRKRVTSAYVDWIRLLQYRHKIVWSYYDSRFQVKNLKKEYVDIQPALKQAKELTNQLQNNRVKINDLQKILTDNLINLSDYADALNYLENQKVTIEVNLENYKTRLASMVSLDRSLTEDKDKNLDSANLDSDFGLNFLNKFSESDIYAKKYKKQVEHDYAHFSPGLTLLGNLNSTIQGVIELERTKTERSIDTTIALAGLGLAMSSLVATAISVQDSAKPTSINIKDIPGVLSSPTFFWSFVVACPFLLALLYRLVVRR